jgi:hypothetical protein
MLSFVHKMSDFVHIFPSWVVYTIFDYVFTPYKLHDAEVTEPTVVTYVLDHAGVPGTANAGDVTLWKSGRRVSRLWRKLVESACCYEGKEFS